MLSNNLDFKNQKNNQKIKIKKILKKKTNYKFKANKK